jgi:oligopeptide/dipeptide ABC transporter ATP-binding protein
MPRRIGDVILEVEDLHTYVFTRWGVVRAVDGVGFTLGQGETLGIVGEVGCGKTMTALSLLRLVPRPAARTVKGAIRLGGENLLDKSEREMRAIRRRRISMILQLILSGEVPSPINPPAGCRFHPRCPFAMPRCAEVVPEEKAIAAGHLVACHLY